MIKKGAILVSIVIALTSLQVLSEAPSGHLNSKQIMALIEGNTVKGQRTVEHLQYQALTARPQFTAYYRPDGQLIEIPSAQVGSQSQLLVPTHGKWWSKKGWLCVVYRDSVRIPGERRCLRVVPGSDKGSYELYSKDGKLRDTWNKILAGDPEGLASK